MMHGTHNVKCKAVLSQLYCLLLKVVLLACTNALALLTDRLKIKRFEDCQNASKNFSRSLLWNPAGLGTVSCQLHIGTEFWGAEGK